MWQLIKEKYGKVTIKELVKYIIVNNKVISDGQSIVNKFSNHYVNCVTDLKDEIPNVNNFEEN
jgi:hypothetical protein